MRSRRGQMAIFIALIFQVLFVLFAMSINVALVVHDKINLQNAVDLAAYYAAERQAEMLNVIAHENYMIRQAWKLLAWRYRVLGGAGTQEPTYHPAYREPNGPWPDTPYAFGPNNRLHPYACVVYAQNWSDVDQNESLCKRSLVSIPPLPQLRVIASFNPVNIIFAAIANQMRAQQTANCSDFGGINWFYSAAIFQAFRVDQRNRKQVIYTLANNMSQANFLDLDGNPVKEGAQKTFEKNLTYSNQNAQTDFKFLNSLEGVRREKWLSEVRIAPMLLYMDPINGQDAASCEGQPQMVTDLPFRQAGRDKIMRSITDGGLQAQDLANVVSLDGVSFLGDDYSFSIGVEKNPWYMAYVGVQAETSPRQIFFPFGGRVTLRARAFAKPFGGRVGPWYGTRWQQGQDHSDSASGKTDPLMAPRLQANGLLNSPNDPLRFPNYSRYPGDQMGLTSMMALGGLSGFAFKKTDLSQFQCVWKPMDNTAAYNDPLLFNCWNPATPAVMRQYELAAIAPDLFDATYYSIEPNFSVNYLRRLRASRDRLGFASNIPLRGDLGSSRVMNLLDFSVQDQMTVARNGQLHRPTAFYYLRDKAHLLTAWASGEMAFEYSSFPSDRFGKCQHPDDNYSPLFKVPGSCAGRGGRTGYSVKLVSRSLLEAPQPIGGDREPAGLIQNPPPGGAGW